MTRSRRLSITQADRATTAGLELLALLQEIADDGVLTLDEVARLDDWLSGNSAADLPSRVHLADIIADVQRDGRITEDELTLVHDAILRVLPPDLRTLATFRRREQRRSAAAKKADARAAEKAARREERERNRVLDRADFMVVGIHYSEERLEACESLDEGSRVWLEREPENPHDRNAIRVKTADGDELGYVPREVAADLAALLDAGARQDAAVKKLLETSRGNIIPVVIAKLYSQDASAGHSQQNPHIGRTRSHPSPPSTPETPPATSTPVAPTIPPSDRPHRPWRLIAVLVITIVFAWLLISTAATFFG